MIYLLYLTILWSFSLTGWEQKISAKAVWHSNGPQTWSLSLWVVWGSKAQMNNGKSYIYHFCGGGFSLAYKDFGRMFDYSFPACAFLFFLLLLSFLSSCTLIPLFLPGSVNSGSASWDDLLVLRCLSNIHPNVKVFNKPRHLTNPKHLNVCFHTLAFSCSQLKKDLSNFAWL